MPNKSELVDNGEGGKPDPKQQPPTENQVGWWETDQPIIGCPYGSGEGA